MTHESAVARFKVSGSDINALLVSARTHCEALSSDKGMYFEATSFDIRPQIRQHQRDTPLTWEAEVIAVGRWPETSA